MRSKGYLGSQVGFIVWGVVFIIMISTASSFFQIKGVDCADPTKVLDKPSENATTVEKVVNPANDLINVFFGCSSSNGIVNGLFVALKAGMILILLKIVKDLVPFT